MGHVWSKLVQKCLGLSPDPYLPRPVQPQRLAQNYPARALSFCQQIVHTRVDRIGNTELAMGFRANKIPIAICMSMHVHICSTMFWNILEQCFRISTIVIGHPNIRGLSLQWLLGETCHSWLLVQGIPSQVQVLHGATCTAPTRRMSFAKSWYACMYI